MLVCERRWHADTAADGCTVLAAAHAAPPSITIASLCSDYRHVQSFVPHSKIFVFGEHGTQMMAVSFRVPFNDSNPQIEYSHPVKKVPRKDS